MNLPSLSPSLADEAGVRAELTAAAGKLVPVLAGLAEEGERLRRVSDDAARALREAGMFRLGTPRTFGGYGADVRTGMEVTARTGPWRRLLRLDHDGLHRGQPHRLDDGRPGP